MIYTRKFTNGTVLFILNLHAFHKLNNYGGETYGGEFRVSFLLQKRNHFHHPRGMVLSLCTEMVAETIRYQGARNIFDSLEIYKKSQSFLLPFSSTFL